MTPFLILLLVPVVLQHTRITGISYQRKNQFALKFFLLMLTFLAMFRHEFIGKDTVNYINYFIRYANTDWKHLSNYAMEIGYMYYNKAIALFSTNYRFFLMVSAATISALIYPTYKRLCQDSSLTIVLFCTMSTFVMIFSGIRQMLAVGIGFVCYEFTRRQKLIPCLLSVWLAVTIHTSGFMLLLMYPVYHAKITKKWLYGIVPVLAGIFVFNRQVFSVLTLILERYTKYEGSISATGAYTMLILFVIFTVFAFLVPEESQLDTETIGLRNFLLLSLAIQMFAPLHNLAMRMNYYYIIFIPLLIPKIIQYRSMRWNKIAVLARHVMVMFFLVYFFVNAYGGTNLKVFPYHFFWENIY